MCRSAPGVLRDFRNVFRNRIFLLGAATLSLSYIPLMSWVAVSPVILMDAGGLTTSEFARAVPVFSAVIIANLSVARWVKTPPARALSSARCRYRCSARHPDRWQSGMAPRLAVVGGRHLLLRLRHRADFPDAVSLYPLFQRPAEGTVSASLNIVILSVSALSIEGARWLWFHGGRLPFHLLAVAAGIVAACCGRTVTPPARTSGDRSPAVVSPLRRKPHHE